MNDGGPSTPAPQKPSKPRAFFYAAQFASLGLEMGLCVAIGVGLGYLADKHWETAPVFMLVGLFLGIAAAGKAIWDAAKRAQKNEASNRQDQGSDGTQGNEKD